MVVSLEDSIIRLRKNNSGNIEILQYFGSRKKSEFRCLNCGHTWWADNYSVTVSGHGCDVCFKKIISEKFKEERITPKEDIIKFVNDSGCDFICFLEKYKGLPTKMKAVFLCGHIDNISVQVFKRPSFTKLCKDCSREISGKKRRIPEENVILEINKHGFSFIGFPNGYENIFSLCEFRCYLGHITKRTFSYFKNHPTCQECVRNEMSQRFSGENSFRWRGGITAIRKHLRHKTKNWVRKSLKENGFKCLITGDEDVEFHHLQGFDLLVQEVFERIDLKILQNVEDYSEKELILIEDVFDEIQFQYPLGVPLRKDIHVVFHQLYGLGNNTPEQFYEFVDKIESGEIIINKQ